MSELVRFFLTQRSAVGIMQKPANKHQGLIPQSLLCTLCTLLLWTLDARGILSVFSPISQAEIEASTPERKKVAFVCI